MYVSIKMLATQEGCSVSTISRIVKEMRECGRYPTAIRRAGKVQVSTEDFEDYVRKRERKRREEKVEGSD